VLALGQFGVLAQAHTCGVAASAGIVLAVWTDNLTKERPQPGFQTQYRWMLERWSTISGKLSFIDVIGAPALQEIRQ
jgi:hypothetical protein